MLRILCRPLTNCWIIRPHNDATSIGTDLAEGLCSRDERMLLDRPIATSYRLLPKQCMMARLPQAACTRKQRTRKAQISEQVNKGPSATTCWFIVHFRRKRLPSSWVKIILMNILGRLTVKLNCLIFLKSNTQYFLFHGQLVLWIAQKEVQMVDIPSGSVGHSSQGSPQPSPFKAQQHSCLEWFLDLGDEHFPPSNLA